MPPSASAAWAIAVSHEVWSVTSQPMATVEPPLLLISLGPAAQILPFLAPGAACGVSFLAEDQARVAMVFADAFPVGEPPFVSEGEPLVAGALVQLACRVERTDEAAGQRLVTLRVVRAVVADGGPLVRFERIEMRGNEYVINGRKWWSSGAGDPRCKIAILMGKTDPDAELHKQQSMILMPLHSPGVTIKRHLPVFGYDDAPHGHMEIELKDVRLPPSNMLLGEGRGFEIAQGRLGPGRIHHCMRTIGAAEEALEAMVKRLMSRTAFGKTIAEQSVWEERVANARIDIEMTRLLCLKAADMMDKAGNKAAQGEIAMIKVAAPIMALKVIDDAIQAFGAAGVSEDTGLAGAYAGIRTLRLADGPDEVHRRAIARLEFKKHR